MPYPVTPVKIRGVVYPSMRAAATAIGVTPAAISLALKENRLETVGLHPRAVPITIDEIRYPSIAAAARALKMNAETLRRKTLDQPEMRG